MTCPNCNNVMLATFLFTSTEYSCLCNHEWMPAIKIKKWAAQQPKPLALYYTTDNKFKGIALVQSDICDFDTVPDNVMFKIFWLEAPGKYPNFHGLRWYYEVPRL